MDRSKFFFFYGIFLFVMFFLIVQHFFQSEEVLTCLFVELLINVFVDVNESRNDHMFQGINTSIGDLDFFI